MAHPRKVREYIEVTETAELYSAVTLGLAEQLATTMQNIGDTQSANNSRIQGEFAQRLKSLVLNTIERLIGEHFTDEELDHIIAFNKTPAAKKLRDIGPEIQKDVLTSLTDNMPQLERMMDEIVHDLRRKAAPKGDGL